MASWRPGKAASSLALDAQLQAGLLIVPGSQECLVFWEHVTGARRGGVLHGLVGLLLDDDVVLRQVKSY
jgi:hypothetical protein